MGEFCYSIRMSTGWKLEHTYTQLPDAFFSNVPPVPVAAPSLIALNHPLAVTLGLDPELLSTDATQILSGNPLPVGTKTLAQAYAGHQFGHFTMLGDGRALLLGEQIDPHGRRWDIQLKGSGQTPYSRRGDGRAAVGPMLREYLISEAMFALGIPTTRSLAVLATGEPVFRETTLPGAVLIRVAASHVRVGTFEYAATLGPEYVRKLADYVIQRHYPELTDSEGRYENLLREVIRRQAHLIADWMNVGFVHGVMNTDNMAISGETIDYGPCAFMDRYDPETVFSSIDRHGRYAYGRQPSIALWNLTRFAETLIPLFDSSEAAAVATAETCLADFPIAFSEQWQEGMRNKLGLFESVPEDESLIADLLTLMHENRLDFTNTFRLIALADTRDHLESDPTLQILKNWNARLARRRRLEERPIEETRTLMRHASPNLIPRNHHVEDALAAAERGDLSSFQELFTALQHPFEDRREHRLYLEPRPVDSEPYRTFCGT